MNIVIAVGIFPPDIGGPADFVARIACWLTQQGHTVEVVCWSNAEGNNDSSYPFLVHRIPRKGSRLRRFFSTMRCVLAAGSKADVIFVNGLAFESQAAALLMRKPTLHKVVGDYAWEMSRSRRWFTGTLEEFQRVTKPIRCRLLCLIRTLPLLCAQKVVTPSSYLQGIVTRWGIAHEKTMVILNSTCDAGAGGDLSLPVFAGSTIATVCRLVPWKGVDRLINIMVQLPYSRLVVAGDGPERAKLEQLACEKLPADRVLFLGQIAKPKVRALLSRSDLFVLNSSYEGLPHVVLEAMAAGVPVVATDVGGTGEVVVHQETGLLVPYGDDNALLEAVRLLLNSEEHRRRLAETAAFRLKSHFSEGTCFSSFESELRALAKGSSR